VAGYCHDAQIKVYNKSGKIIHSNDVELTEGGNSFYIRADELKAGLYIVSLESEGMHIL